MAATLRMCLMVHVEPATDWDDMEARDLADLATKVGAAQNPGSDPEKEAKLSVQFGRSFLDSTPGGGYSGPTSLSRILSNGGNFWCHTHDSDYATLSSTYWLVSSAYSDETAGGDTGSVGGRSGGVNVGGTDDWVSITQARGLMMMNSATQKSYDQVSQNSRPYAFSDDDLDDLYPKGPAPGPLWPDVWTMRQRPFWMKTAANWVEKLNTIYPQTSYASANSVIMIPAPGHLDLTRLANPRGADSSGGSIGADDLKAALTQVWTTYQLMATHQNSITNVWYTHIPQAVVGGNTNNAIAELVTSINDLMGVTSTTPFGAWNNMNEIGSLFANPSSFNY